METKLRLAFIKDWHDDLEHLGGNFDGHLASVSELAKKYDLSFITRSIEKNNLSLEKNGLRYLCLEEDEKINTSQFDIAICWGSLDRPWHSDFIKRFNCPKILLFAGGPLNHPNLSNFDLVLVESKVYEDEFSKMGVLVRRAFGVNTEIFRPELRTPKIFDAIYPASFCFHKNQELFARAIGSRGLCVGTWNEMDIVGRLLELKTPVLRKVSSSSLCDLFNMSRVCVIPCGPNGGSQRTVLESMACGVPVVLANDNDKCAEFIEESGFGELVHPVENEIREAVDRLIENRPDPMIGRNYVLSKWTHYHFAESIDKAIKEMVLV